MEGEEGWINPCRPCVCREQGKEEDPWEGTGDGIVGEVGGNPRETSLPEATSVSDIVRRVKSLREIVCDGD